LKKIIVAINGDSVDEDALSLAIQITKGHKYEIFALYVIEVERELPVDADAVDKTRKGELVLGSAEQFAKRERVDISADLLQAREAGPAIVKESEEREVDCIVLGLPYKKKYGSFSVGNAVPYILENASCSVLVLREPQEKALHSVNLEAE
jgi:nucleotide-binding universal stress UspA family protein